MKKVIITIFILAILAMSFYAGLRMGGENYLLANSSNEAFILSNELRMLRSGNSEAVVFSKELKLYSQIRFHEKYLDSNFNWLYLELTQNSEKNMKQAVKYLLDFPYKSPEIEGENNDFSVQVNHGLEELNQSVDRMIEAYK